MPAANPAPTRPGRHRVRRGVGCIVLWGLGTLAQAGPGTAAAPVSAPAPLAEPARRVVSLLPSLTETVCALGACDRLVGVDRWSNWPESVRALPQLGGQHDVDWESVMLLQTDLVLLPRSSRAQARLATLGLPVLALEPDTLAATFESFRVVAWALGQPAAGERLTQRLTAQLQAAARRMPAHRRGQRVYLEIASTPHAAGAASFVGEVLTQLGLRNIVDARLGPFPQLNPEAIVRADPELIIVAARSAPTLAQRPGWGRMAAVRAGRICALPPTHWDALVRPGPRLGEAADRLVDCLAALPH